jgi:hypothetical protein
VKPAEIRPFASGVCLKFNKKNLSNKCGPSRSECPGLAKSPNKKAIFTHRNFLKLLLEMQTRREGGEELENNPNL